MDSDDDYEGPALPPHLVNKNQQTNQKPASTVIGPSLPSHITKQQLQDDQGDDDDDDDSDGPQPLPSNVKIDDKNEGIREFIERENKLKQQDEEASKPKKQEREEWMIVPPKNMDILGSGDPTKIKARGFNQTTKPTDSGNGPNLWTETPDERAKRLEDEVAGKRAPALQKKALTAEEEADERRKRKRDESTRREIEEHNKRNRPLTLMEQHQKRLEEDSKPHKKDKERSDRKDRDKEKEKDRKRDKKDKTSSKKKKKSRRYSSSSSDGNNDRADNKDKEESVKKGPPPIWDYERDMKPGGGGVIGEKQRNNMIEQARGLGSRFGPSRFAK